MAFTYTEEQQEVIHVRNKNVLVSAAAGSGKTAVLVERIIQMVCDEKDRTDIDRLLVVTFTNAAATEMRERIRKAIDEKLEKEPENMHLQRQATLLYNAQITTIDKFCLFLIRNNFNDIGLDPGFRVADEGELKLLKQDVLTALLEEKYDEKEEAFRNCVEYFTGGEDDRRLEEYIDRIYEFAMSNPWPEEWLSERKKDYRLTGVEEMEKTDWCRFLLNYVRQSLEDIAGTYREAVQIAMEPDGPYFYAALLEKEQEMTEKLAEKPAGEEGLQRLYEKFGALDFGRLPSKKDPSVSPLLREQAKELRSRSKKRLQELQKRFFLLSPDQSLARMQAAEEPVCELIDLVLSYKQRLDAEKRAGNLIDFHDMEHLALQILLKKDGEGGYVPTGAALEYRSYFKEIMIDEYQDSNLVQELLLQSISTEEEGVFNRFMVGDVKQSIYKFRLARPELFTEKYNCYKTVDPYRQRIDLHKNFRSRTEVLQSVNALFEKIMSGEFGGIDYDKDAALYPGASYPENDQNETEVILINTNQELRETKREQEAAMIGSRIRELMQGFRVTDADSGLLRPVRYRDIVILLRTASGWAEDFKKVLEKEGIPAYVSSRTGYFEAPEVREVLNLLRILNNPLQDIPLYGTLKSFFGALTDEEIARIRNAAGWEERLRSESRSAGDPEEKSGDDRNREERPEDVRSRYLYELVTAYHARDIDSPEEEIIKSKVNKFLTRIEKWRRMSAYTSIHALLQSILTETGYLEYVSARAGGGQKAANVEMLLTKAAAFENTSYYGLFHFLRYIEKLEKYEVDYGEAEILDENADVVRIMSIHKSKGLEFPVCFVAGLSKEFNMRDLSERFIADVDMGIGVDFVDRDRRIQSKTLRKNAVALKLRVDALAEEIRILYVAMTRAKEKLILTGMVNDCAALEEEMRLLSRIEEKQEGKKLSYSRLAESASYLDFLLPTLQAEQIRWVTEENKITREINEHAKEFSKKELLLRAETDPKWMDALKDRFSRKYPYPYLDNLYIKTSVSELKHAAMEEECRLLFEEKETVPYIPSFVKKEEAKLGGSERGSAYHRVMELLDYKKLKGLVEQKEEAALPAELKEEIREMTAAEKLPAEWEEAVSCRKIASFLRSGTAEGMLQAAEEDKLYLEQPFVLGLAATELDPSYPEDEMVLIQGIIDVFYETKEGLILLDYKTDHVRNAGELASRYQTQLDYYARALSRLTGKKVLKKVIYSFGLEEEILLP